MVQLFPNYCYTILNFILWSLLTTVVQSWKLDICIRGTTVTVVEEECPYGIWFSQPWEISSACVDGGVWAIYRNWCDISEIWTSHPSKDGGCIRRDILTQVVGMVYLGEESTGAVISTKRHKLFLTSDYFERKMRGKLSSNNDNNNINNSTTVKSNTSKNPTTTTVSSYPFSSSSWTMNLNESEVEILVWGSSLYMAHSISPGLEVHKCLLKGRHTYSASYAFPLMSRHNLKFGIEKVQTCISHRRWQFNNQLVPLHLDRVVSVSSVQQSSSSNQEFHCTPKNATFNSKIRSRTFKRNIENINYMSHSRDKDLMTVNDVTRINEQTERLARKLIAHVFVEEPLPEMDFMEWKFLMIAQDIFEKACPSNLVPRDFFENMMRFFRFILVESFDKFPPNIDEDVDTQGRIEKNLKNCLNGATPIKFKINSQCPKTSASLIIEYKHENGTTQDVKVEIPEKVKLDAEKFDVILESAWKLQVFIHYYCADYFKETPQDLSTLHQRWQELFAPDILTRWQCPGKSYEMVQTLIRNVELQTALKYLDICVAAVHINSSYPGWVKRPLPVLKNRKPGKTTQDKRPQKIQPEVRTSNKNTRRRLGLGLGIWDNGFDFYSSRIGSGIPEPEWDHVTYCMDSYNYPAEALGFPYEKCGVFPGA